MSSLMLLPGGEMIKTEPIFWLIPFPIVRSNITTDNTASANHCWCFRSFVWPAKMAPRQSRPLPWHHAPKPWSVSQECFSLLSCHTLFNSTSFTGSSQRCFTTLFTFSLLLLFKSRLTHFLVHICKTAFKYLNLKNILRVFNKGLLN